MNDVDLRTLAQRGAIHFVGIGGAGMSALAELALHFGARVTGCDSHLNEAAIHLRTLGAEIWEGHDPAHVEDAGAVITTAAVGFDSPELIAAKERKIPVIKRAQALGALVNRGTVIAVAGTHGKTTTTAMTASVLSEAGLEPTAFVGGRVPEWSGGLLKGGEEHYVVEADEYDRSFLALKPTVAIVTNLEADHLDIYGNFEGVKEAFGKFLSLLPNHGCAIICADDEGARVAAGKRKGVTFYGIDDKRAQLRAENVENRGSGSRFRVTYKREELGEVMLGVPGMHNVRNALAAIGAARYLDVPFEAVQEALPKFTGVGRRFQEIGKARNITIVDDYAHHPTEIRAAIAAARGAYGKSRIVAVFQPHLYSRTRDFATDFGDALNGADDVWVTDVYAAREQPIKGVTGELIANAAKNAHYVQSLDELPDAIRQTLAAGDVCLFMGAGTIDTASKQLLAQLKGEA
ncbi:MAG TPA: UDP-N-acetylmuramate--L-alanine ligase [Longimicrobiales bacterium]|nr:UDP-N-acetylmuramate--L-alanine ligase [Longimicrobiales bacterium]